MNEHERRGFRLEITSFEEFALFCALIRGKALDDEEIRKQIERLKEDKEPLKTAVEQNT